MPEFSPLDGVVLAIAFIAVTRGFFQRPSIGSNSQAVQDFYSTLDKRRQEAKSAEIKDEMRDAAGVVTHREKYPTAYRDDVLKDLEDGNKALSELWDHWRVIRTSTNPNLTDESRRIQLAEIEERISQTALRLVDRHRMMFDQTNQEKR